MDNRKIARELIVIAKEINSSSDRIINKAVGPYWNELNDLYDELNNVYREYDLVSNYEIDDNNKKMMVLSLKIKDLLIDTMHMVRDISKNKLSELTDLERKFVKEYGSPEEVVEKARGRIFPR